MFANDQSSSSSSLALPRRCHVFRTGARRRGCALASVDVGPPSSQLASLSITLADFEFFVCYYATGGWLPGASGGGWVWCGGGDDGVVAQMQSVPTAKRMT